MRTLLRAFHRARPSWLLPAVVRHLLLWLMVALSELTPAVSHADAARPNEVSIGLGGATSWEESVFNLPTDLKSSPDRFWQLAYRRNISPHLALGLQAYGPEEMVGDYVITDAGGSRTVRFDLTTLNIGAHVRWSFREANPRLYVTANANSVSGSASLGNQELEYMGFSAGGGPGIQWVFGGRVGLAVEGIASFGMAEWKSLPFPNSTSRDFNPSVAAVFASLSFHWGEAPTNRAR